MIIKIMLLGEQESFCAREGGGRQNGVDLHSTSKRWIITLFFLLYSPWTCACKIADTDLRTPIMAEICPRVREQNILGEGGKEVTKE